MTYEHEGTRRIRYEGGAVFVPVCLGCGRFIIPDETIYVNEESGLKQQPNATCSRCGRVEMFFEGFLP